MAVLLWLAASYLLVNLRLPAALEVGYNIYLAQPLLWTSLTILSYLGWRFGLARRPRLRLSRLLLAVLIGLFQVSMLTVGGLISGFGRSPYSHQVPGMLGNALYLVSMLLGLELSRGYLVAAFRRAGMLGALLAVSTLYALAGIPLARLASVQDVPLLFRFCGESLLPGLAESLLASYLALIGGPLVSLAYRLTLAGFEWAMPVLPDLSWSMTAFIGTLAPAAGLLVVQDQTGREAPAARPSERREATGSWAVVALLSTTLIWFNSGLFGFRPSVVSGVSMEPALVVGDLVVTRQVAPEEVGVGDVIRYRIGRAYVLHRVVEIVHDGGGMTFITRGDANNVADAPVAAEQVDGKVVAVISRLGWLSIGVRRLVGMIPWPGG